MPAVTNVDPKTITPPTPSGTERNRPADIIRDIAGPGWANRPVDKNYPPGSPDARRVYSEREQENKKMSDDGMIERFGGLTAAQKKELDDIQPPELRDQVKHEMVQELRANYLVNNPGSLDKHENWGDVSKLLVHGIPVGGDAKVPEPGDTGNKQALLDYADKAGMSQPEIGRLEEQIRGLSQGKDADGKYHFEPREGDSAGDVAKREDAAAKQMITDLKAREADPSADVLGARPAAGPESVGPITKIGENSMFFDEGRHTVSVTTDKDGKSQVAITNKKTGEVTTLTDEDLKSGDGAYTFDLNDGTSVRIDPKAAGGIGKVTFTDEDNPDGGYQITGFEGKKLVASEADSKTLTALAKDPSTTVFEVNGKQTTLEDAWTKTQPGGTAAADGGEEVPPEGGEDEPLPAGEETGPTTGPAQTPAEWGETMKEMFADFLSSGGTVTFECNGFKITLDGSDVDGESGDETPSPSVGSTAIPPARNWTDALH